MFYSVTGKIVAIEDSCVAVQCGGVAFRCYTSLNTISKIGRTGEEATLYTHLSVKEDALTLYGFYTQSELDCFKLLITVSGVGPKAAVAILSQLSPDQLSLCIASGDVKSITKAQGVGAKIAQRVVLELKDKLSLPSSSSGVSVNVNEFTHAGSGNIAEAVEALVMLGYSKSEAASAVSKLDPSLSSEELIRLSLKSLI